MCFFACQPTSQPEAPAFAPFCTSHNSRAESAHPHRAVRRPVVRPARHAADWKLPMPRPALAPAQAAHEPLQRLTQRPTAQVDAAAGPLLDHLHLYTVCSQNANARAHTAPHCPGGCCSWPAPEPPPPAHSLQSARKCHGSHSPHCPGGCCSWPAPEQSAVKMQMPGLTQRPTAQVDAAAGPLLNHPHLPTVCSQRANATAHTAPHCPGGCCSWPAPEQSAVKMQMPGLTQRPTAQVDAAAGPLLNHRHLPTVCSQRADARVQAGWVLHLGVPRW